MRVERYRRARLCRLCEGPIVDGGVLLVQKRYMDRLRRWWKANFGAEYTKKHCRVCYFCAWDFRFADENSESKEPLDLKWWPPVKSKHQKNASKYYPYYCDELTKPCSVKITPVAPELLAHRETQQRGATKTNWCIYCPNVYKNFNNLLKHTQRDHPEKEIRCGIAPCRRFFHTLEEKLQHQEKEHAPKKDEPFIKCFYCEKVCINYASHLSHQHRGQVIKCEFYTCKMFFKTKEERDQHIKEKHNSGTYFCCFCDRYFEDLYLQLKHMRTYHKDEALKCNAVQHCPNYFKTEEDRQKHVLEKHSKVKSFKCLYCSKFVLKSWSQNHMRKMHQDVAISCKIKKCVTFFKTEEEKQKHFEEIHEKHEFFCIYCDKKVLYKTGLSMHLSAYHSEKEIFRCSYNYCVTYFKSEEEKWAHTKQVHLSSDVCVYCDKLLPKGQLGNMKKHVDRHHSDVAIRCNYHRFCPTYFKTTEEREKHIKEVHLDKKIRKPVECLYCGTLIANVQIFRRHVKKMHLDVAIKCQFPSCGLYFKRQEDLEAHFILKPEHKAILRSFPCLLCPSTYISKSGLKSHKKVVHERKKSYCPHCQKPMSSLYGHMEAVFCKFCKNKFLCPGLLKNHSPTCNKRIHNCMICAKSFQKHSVLMLHCRRNHTVRIRQWRGLEYKSLGFKCDECFVYFKHESSFKFHFQTVHTGFDATCHFCKRQFSRRNVLRIHIVRKHL